MTPPPSVRVGRVEVPWDAENFAYQLRVRIGLFDVIEIYAEDEGWTARLRDTADQTDALHFCSDTLAGCVAELTDQLRRMRSALDEVL